MDHTWVTTERLRLRHPRREDARPLALIFADPEVMTYLGGPRDYDEIVAEIEAEVGAEPKPLDLWPLELVAERRVIGFCGLVPKDVDGVQEHEVVYILARDAWGHGYATEAAAGLIDYAFTVHGFNHVISMIHADNAASVRVAERNGMTHDRDTVRPSGKQLGVYVRHRDPA
jgi:RimJ/RimL family protein N-acetyltransferase